MTTFMHKKRQKNKEKKNNWSDNEQSSKNISETEEIVTENERVKIVEKPFAPVQATMKGVTMKVTAMKKEQGSLLLKVNLKNNGQKTVRFLYSFLEIKDDQNNSVSSITSGLPTELPANGDNFSGEISIPLSLLNQSKTISLNLPDYPEQNLQIQINAIPVIR